VVISNPLLRFPPLEYFLDLSLRILADGKSLGAALDIQTKLCEELRYTVDDETPNLENLEKGIWATANFNAVYVQLESEPWTSRHRYVTWKVLQQLSL